MGYITGKGFLSQYYSHRLCSNIISLINSLGKLDRILLKNGSAVIVKCIKTLLLSLVSIYYNNQTEILDNSSDLSVYNENNSKILTILNMYLSDDIIIRKMICNDSSIYLLMKANNEEYYDVISESDAINIMYNHTVIFTESKKEINFIEDGEKYKIIKIDDTLYLQHEKKDDLLLPSNLILNGSVFQKKYRYDNI